MKDKWDEINNVHPNSRQSKKREIENPIDIGFEVPKNEEVEITKYPNRKMYCRGSYISLKHVFMMIRNGCTLKVVCHDTLEDITDNTLKSILIESIKRQNIDSKVLLSLVSSTELPGVPVKFEKDESRTEAIKKYRAFENRINLRNMMEWIESEALKLAIANSTSVSEAARLLCLSRTTFIEKSNRLAVSRDKLTEKKEEGQKEDEIFDPDNDSYISWMNI